MPEARRRALQASDVLLATLTYTAFWAVTIVVVSVADRLSAQPAGLAGGLPTWFLATLGTLPIFVGAGAVFTVTGLALRRPVRDVWLVVAFAVAGVVAFALVILALTEFSGELFALDWGLRQVVTLVALPAAGGTLAGLVSARRAGRRADGAVPAR
ncbi:hypothetical protein [Georgenia alba]|uniref:Major facilitator superfamily (MFS) profile domain-containing protein n=1 Tax=Georgenia alba TaxID=2233858 RepID=A0ABW2Q491_9MICO